MCENVKKPTTCEILKLFYFHLLKLQFTCEKSGINMRRSKYVISCAKFCFHIRKLNSLVKMSSSLWEIIFFSHVHM